MMVTLVAGSTLPLLSVTVPVIPPSVCCASARGGNNESIVSPARKKMPSFIFFAIVTSSDLRNRNPIRSWDRLLELSTPWYKNYLAQTEWLENQCRQMYDKSGQTGRRAANENSFGENQ